MAAAIPEKCTVLVIGGGPGGSYAAAVLARENIDTVVIEAEKMPRYHIGESFLASFRHYLKFIDLHTKFDNYGFVIKHGAVFKMSPHRKEGFTDFRAPNEDNRSWNVVRSEADELMFRHAEESGAKVFDGVRISSINFGESANGHSNGDAAHPALGRPVSAQWSRKETGESGTIKFDYVVDASGRAGLLSTKYLKNRTFSQALKNVANWAYFSGGGTYGKGTDREGVPFFEALRDESGWAWFIPLHNGTHSVGYVRNQEISNKLKAANKEKSNQEHYEDALKLAPMLTELLGPNAKQVSSLHSGADFSYHASTYALPYARIVGDAGCFIDPFFSSGVHLAVTGALSAGATIAASIRGDLSEERASNWHSHKIRESYARFLMVVISAYQQMRNQKEPVLSELGEDNFDRAFSFFKPVIQGTADATKKMRTRQRERGKGTKKMTSV
ncbi:hypothetical protein M406DRAFT_335784 [Cryphonectria parasitica EP155]|uniref:FAD/NAD(P)-binding domain-containing protein n=1 Tax=Cryphonectria parasitica (strain ATCC 38755 / EP155) TaxID=660469 RepID=A0A9P4YB03_CRYP1|nr:uncharacterized protein M406DRAFT_335784 [Cryphonectria parasitica EP155]KAF3770026.1 hypothetical protein M406DRAFT_335784 [Cryphonectria parasitica EP155]